MKNLLGLLRFMIAIVFALSTNANATDSLTSSLYTNSSRPLPVAQSQHVSMGALASTTSSHISQFDKKNDKEASFLAKRSVKRPSEMELIARFPDEMKIHVSHDAVGSWVDELQNLSIDCTVTLDELSALLDAPHDIVHAVPGSLIFIGSGRPIVVLKSKGPNFGTPKLGVILEEVLKQLGR